ncbi:MAG: DsrE family protein [Gammaproteobacteria bacterium]|nr:DsrE family protein [Gammaproteobacteria bacterium]
MKRDTGSNVIHRIFLTGCLLLFCSYTFANEDLQKVLNLSETPNGVVFEIVDSDEQALGVILPRVRKAIGQIRERFPKTDFAVVSHGREEFALQAQYQQSLPVIHQQVQSLVADEVPVHVCETHAGWYGVVAEDFPDYVNVAPTGPGQINLYIEMGYELIVME